MKLDPILPLHIDSTMISCFRSCPQKFFLEFVCGLRPSGKSIDLHAGACFSATLEAFYKSYWIEHCDVQLALARAHSTFMRLWGDFQSNKPSSPKTIESVWNAFEHYIASYPPATDHIQPYFVNGKPTFEFSFAVPLDFPDFPRHPSGAPFIYSGRPDLLGHWNGKTVIRDEKTSARLDSNWSEQWDLRSQFIGYVWVTNYAGIPCDTVAVRGIIINKTQIRQVEAFKIYTQQDQSRWFEQLRRDLWRIRRSWDESYWDWNLGEACTAYGSCMFAGPCKSTKPENWWSTYEVSRWNPLSRNPIDPPSTAGSPPPPSPVSKNASTSNGSAATEKAPSPAVALAAGGS
jgi:hypothetical protein